MTEAAAFAEGSTNEAASASAGSNVTFILGAARSGTTWLAKIFDSHPDVLYRHEPDTILRGEELPLLCEISELAQYRGEMEAYLDRLITVRTLKSAGSLPVFAKGYRSQPAQLLHTAFIYGLRAADLALLGMSWPQRLPIPDLVTRGASAIPHHVVKSVSSCGRARLFAEAFPGSRIIFIIRHPCGQVASMLRGVSLGKFDEFFPLRDEDIEQASSRGLIPPGFETLLPVEQYAWHWAIINQTALDDLAGLSQVRIVRYEDLCFSPLATASALFAFAGLSWDPQTAAFLERSSTYKGASRYYQVMKDSPAAANKWRTDLSPDDQQRILAIARQVPAGHLFDA